MLPSMTLHHWRYGAMAPWAIVPLKPNELNRPRKAPLGDMSSPHATTSTGIKKCSETIERRCMFNLCFDSSQAWTGNTTLTATAEPPPRSSKCLTARAEDSPSQRQPQTPPSGPYSTSKTCTALKTRLRPCGHRGLQERHPPGMPLHPANQIEMDCLDWIPESRACPVRFERATPKINTVDRF